MVYLPPETDAWLAEKFKVAGMKVCPSECLLVCNELPVSFRKKRREYQRNGKLQQQKLTAIQSTHYFLTSADKSRPFHQTTSEKD